LFFGTVVEVEPPPVEEARVVVVVAATFEGPELVERSMRYVAPTKRIKMMRTTPMAG
jgi:hypothetical protein